MNIQHIITIIIIIIELTRQMSNIGMHSARENGIA